MTESSFAEAGFRLVQRSNPLYLAFSRSLERHEDEGSDALRRYAERRLVTLARLAAVRSTFYRELFRRTGLYPGSIRSPEDLTQLPLLTRGHLVESPERFLTLPRAFLREAHTSGTSGEPATCFRTPGSIVFELVALDRQLRWHGVRPGLRTLVIRTEFAPDGSGVLSRLRGARHLQISPRALTPRTLPDLMEHVARFRPQMIEGWPSRLAEFAQMLSDAGRRLPLAAVRTSSEPIFPGQRELFRDVFGGAHVDLYGQTERAAMGGTCEEGSYHLFTDYGIVELLPTERPSERLEIVGTPLHNWGFPIFRYRTGDFVRVDGDARCSCGRPFPVISAIEGRLESLVEAADGRKIPLASAVLDDLAGVREAQLVQHRPGVFEIRVIPGRSFDSAVLDRQIRANVDRFIGAGASTSVTVVEAIDRDEGGKRSAVVVRGRDEQTGALA